VCKRDDKNAVGVRAVRIQWSANTRVAAEKENTCCIEGALALEKACNNKLVMNVSLNNCINRIVCLNACQNLDILMMEDRPVVTSQVEKDNMIDDRPGCQ
jgi:hypothetical protein